MIKIFTVPLQDDLTEFTQFLWQKNVPHRVIEDEQCQTLWVGHHVNPDDIYALYQMWCEGGDLSQVLFSNSVVELSVPINQRSFIVLAKRAWLSSLLIVISIVLSFAISFGDNVELLRYFSIADFVQRGDSFYSTGLVGTIETREYWRFITPIFLHFGAPHIVFNVLWIWVAGMRIECQHGRSALFVLIVFSGVVSNVAQYWVSGPLFGGLSGVVFAFLGYCWLWDKFYAPKLNLPSALMGFMVVWLVLGYSGLLGILGFGSIANTAHLAGLGAGLLFVPLGKRLAKAKG